VHHQSRRRSAAKAGRRTFWVILLLLAFAVVAAVAFELNYLSSSSGIVPASSANGSYSEPTISNAQNPNNQSSAYLLVNSLSKSGNVSAFYFDYVLQGQGMAYNSSGYVYSANYYNNTVSIIRNSTLVGIIRINTPWSVVYDKSNGYVYIDSHLLDSVYVVKGSEIIATLSVGESPTSMLYDPADGYVYVASFRNGSVAVISNVSIIRSIGVGPSPDYIAYSPATRSIYVSGLLFIDQGDTGVSDNVTEINGINITEVAALGRGPMGRGPSMGIYDNKTGAMYFTRQISNSIVALLNNGSLLEIYNGSLAAEPFYGIYDKVNGLVYVLSSIHINGTQKVLGFSGTSLNYSFNVPDGTLALGYDPASNSLYGINFVYGRLYSFYGTSMERNVSTISNPTYILYDPINNYTYVSSHFNGMVASYNRSLASTVIDG
jgi:DNA-binding beta-propeller fold protein YncE